MTDAAGATSRAAAAMHNVVAAIDIGATKTAVALIPLPIPAHPGPMLAARTFPTERAPDAALQRIVDAIRDALAADRRASLVAIGCAAPGPLDAQAGVVTHSPNLRWRDVAIGSPVGAAFGVPWALDDDANLAALGEAVLGAGRGCRVVAYLTVSTGIGSGIVVDGELMAGGHGLAGEVGHLSVNPEGPRCSCGRRGHVEAYAGGAGLAARARETWAKRRLADGSPAPIDAAGVFRAARRDQRARKIIAEATDALATGIAAIAAIVDPNVFVVGGALAVAQPRFIQRAARLAARRVLAETGRQLQVRQATLGPAGALHGAAIAAARLVR
jgi:glucokinase